MKVKCENEWCAYCSNNLVCTLEEIELDQDGDCTTYQSYTDVAKEYQNRFYKHIKSKKDGHGCKKECYGKRIERFGLVFFTKDDDRYKPDEVGCTEEVTGYYCGSLSELTEKRCDEIKKRINGITPVKDVPDADPWEDFDPWDDL